MKLNNKDGGAHPARPWARTLVAALVGAVIMLVVVLLVGAPMALLHRQNLPLETAYGNAVVSMAARIQAGNEANPVAANPRALQSGRDAYTGSCSSCHGNDGKGNGVNGQASFPPATDLTTENAREMSDAELFWITKHGLSFTGMPAFGAQYNDQDIWALVSYLRALQNGQAQPVQVPQTTKAQLDVADPNGAAAQRGAAVYFAQGCASCHGAVGNAPANLGLRGSGETGAIRRGRPGMPAYGTNQISDTQLSDLEAYLGTFRGQSGRGGGDFREGRTRSEGDG